MRENEPSGRHSAFAMPVLYHHSSSVRAERTIVIARIVLAASSLFALWLDPAEPIRYTQLTWALHVLYVGYAVAIAAVVWRLPGARALRLGTHAFDIVVFSVFHYLTHGPSSPFYAYFLFSLFCGAMRWGWRGALITAAIVMSAFVAIGLSLGTARPQREYEINAFVIRFVHLGIVAGLLVYLGRHEARLRDEIQRLADWPRLAGSSDATVVPRVLEHAARVVNASRAVAVWEIGEEPWVHLAAWSVEGATVERHPPGRFDPLVPAPLSSATILSANPADPAAVTTARERGESRPWRGAAVHEALVPFLQGGGLASARFPEGLINGRLFFAGLATTAGDIVALTELVAREVGASLELLSAAERQRQIAVREERIRVSRDLHDGVLQAMTGIRLELGSIAESLSEESRRAVHARLVAAERALAAEQRELRSFIEGLRPVEPSTSLLERLQTLRQRVARQGRASIEIGLADPGLALPPAIERALLLMVHEAVINALKHASPTRVTVQIDKHEGLLRLTVSDDGRGFEFHGRYDHTTLAQAKLGPVSLRERAAALGGELAIESSAAGSRVEICLPLSARSA